MSLPQMEKGSPDATTMVPSTIFQSLVQQFQIAGNSVPSLPGA